MKFVTTNLDGVSLGMPRGSGRSASFDISRPATAGFRVRSDDPLWDEIADEETMLKIYGEDDALLYWGPVVSDEENGSGQGSSTQVSSSDLAWRFAARYVGKDPSGVGTKFTAQPVGTIVSTLLAALNAEDPTGVTIGTVDPLLSVTTTYLWKRMLDVVTELGAPAGSYEWQLRYTDGTPPVVQLDLLAALGTDRTSAVFFEYGCGKRNCKAYSRVRTRDRLATHVWALGSGSTIVASAFDTAAADELRSRYEDVLALGGITVVALLDALAAAHVAVRSQPRRIYSMTPFRGGPVFGVDYKLGDLVTCRIVSEGSVRANGAARVWGVSVEPDDLGLVTAIPRLVPA
ncbi:MAG TPA: hypothetical protein VNI55_06560 [Gaiellaceae bacterium]|nr:hypothetical protein [Gaiellaceae bacterium]